MPTTKNPPQPFQDSALAFLQRSLAVFRASRGGMPRQAATAWFSTCSRSALAGLTCRHRGPLQTMGSILPCTLKCLLVKITPIIRVQRPVCDFGHRLGFEDLRCGREDKKAWSRRNSGTTGTSRDVAQSTPGSLGASEDLHQVLGSRLLRCCCWRMCRAGTAGALLSGFLRRMADTDIDSPGPDTFRRTPDRCCVTKETS